MMFEAHLQGDENHASIRTYILQYCEYHRKVNTGRKWPTKVPLCAESCVSGEFKGEKSANLTTFDVHPSESFATLSANFPAFQPPSPS